MYYSTTEAALALGIERKILDNLLIGPARSLVPKGRNGLARGLESAVIERLALALLLQRDLSIPTRTGVELGARLFDSEDQRISIGTLGMLEFDVRRLKVVVRQALADVVQDRTPIRRGRPIRTEQKRGASL